MADEYSFVTVWHDHDFVETSFHEHAVEHRARELVLQAMNMGNTTASS